MADREGNFRSSTINAQSSNRQTHSQQTDENVTHFHPSDLQRSVVFFLSPQMTSLFPLHRPASVPTPVSRFPLSSTDPQVVAHVFRPAVVRDTTAGLPSHPTTSPPPDPPRGAARHLLLHHHRLAGLAVGATRLLESSRVGGALDHWGGAARG